MFYRHIVLAIMLITSFSMSGVAAGGTDPAAVCAHKKAKAAGKKAFDFLVAFGRNAKKIDPQRLAVDLSKAESRFTRQFDMAEAAGGCQTMGDASGIEVTVDALVAEVLRKLSPQCGDGLLTVDEECDDGATVDGDCCSSSCRLDPTGTPCLPGDGNVCTDDVCDGNGMCEHVANNVPCDDGIFCNGADVCAAAGCSLHSGDPCVGGPECNATCDENSWSCFDPGGTPCGDPSNTQCTDPDTCDGAGACQANDAAEGTHCGDTGSECANQDTCLGGICEDNGSQPPGTSCGDPADTECTNPDTCDGTGSCDPNDDAAGTPCGDPSDTECSDPDSCNGNGSCDPNNETPGTPCTDGECFATGECAPCDCCSFTSGLLSFETTPATGTGSCGALRNFRCSNDGNTVCAVDADCGASNTCNDVIGFGLPLDLECGGLYTGGGGNSVPLPLTVPDMGKFYTMVTSCDPETGELISGATAPGDGGGIVSDRNCTTGRTCTGGSDDGAACVLDADCDSNVCTTNCVFGPPVPIPNAMTPPTSVCTVNDVAEDVVATTQCGGGATTVAAPLRSNVFLTGDLFSMIMPPNIPGVQPCPLCTRQCAAGASVRSPCDTDSDCPGSTCTAGTLCLGGPNDTMACTPDTSDSVTIGDAQNAFPTSHDCPPEPSSSITDSFGGLAIGFALTSGTVVKNAEGLGPGIGGNRVFAGYCRDSIVAGTLCFEGDTANFCPPAIPPADGNAVPCDSDADCADADEYESCAQRNAGAFSRPAATQIRVFGQTDGACLADGLPHSTDLVSVFDMPPTFDATVDSSRDLPGPGAVMLQGTAQLSP